jgi:hypothetical protein
MSEWFCRPDEGHLRLDWSRRSLTRRESPTALALNGREMRRERERNNRKAKAQQLRRVQRGFS